MAAKFADDEKALDELKPWSVIQKMKLQKEVEDDKAAIRAAELEKDRLAGLKADRIAELGRGSITLDELRSVREGLEAELAQTEEQLCELASARDQAEEEWNEARKLLGKLVLEKPAEGDFAHKNLRSLIWRPI